MALLADPRIFSYLIMLLFVMNSIRWAFEQNWAQVCYWILSCLITAVITFGFSN